MDYLTAWREGHEAGMALTLKIINDLTGQDFKKASEVILYIKHLEGDTDFHFNVPEKPKQDEVKDDELSAKEEKFIDRLADKIAMRDWAWS